MGFEAITGPNWIVPTPAAGDSSHRVADTEFVTNAVAAGTTGFMLQTQYAENNALVTSTTTMAGGADTVPVKTDGTSIVSVTITPASTGNKLMVNAFAVVNNTAAVNMWMGLFQDTTTSALAATFVGAGPNGNIVAQAALAYNFAAGTTGPTTLSIRIGNLNGTVSTWVVNGVANTPVRRLGGASRATITVQEIHG